MSRAGSMPGAAPYYVVDDDEDDDVQIIGVNTLNSQPADGPRFGEYRLDAAPVEMTPRTFYQNYNTSYLGEPFHHLHHGYLANPQMAVATPAAAFEGIPTPMPFQNIYQTPSRDCSAVAESISSSYFSGSSSSSGEATRSESEIDPFSSQTQTVESQPAVPETQSVTDASKAEWTGLAYGNILSVLVGPKNSEFPGQPTQFPPSFFSDLAHTLVMSFPFEEFASNHNCTIEEVNHALIAYVIAPLIKCHSVDKKQMEATAIAIYNRWVPPESRVSIPSTPTKASTPAKATTPTKAPTPVKRDVEEQTPTHQAAPQPAEYTPAPPAPATEEPAIPSSHGVPEQQACVKQSTPEDTKTQAQHSPIQQAPKEASPAPIPQELVAAEDHNSVPPQEENILPAPELTREETLAYARVLLDGIAEYAFGTDDTNNEAQNVQASQAITVTQKTQAQPAKTTQKPQTQTIKITKKRQVSQSSPEPQVGPAPKALKLSPNTRVLKRTKTPIPSSRSTSNSSEASTPQSILKKTKRPHQAIEGEGQAQQGEPSLEQREDTPRLTKKVRFDYLPPSPKTCARKGVLPLPKLHNNPDLWIENNEKISKMKTYPADPKPYVPLTEETRIKRHRVTVDPFGNYEKVSEYEDVDPRMTQLLLSQGIPLSKHPRTKRELTRRDIEKINKGQKSLYKYAMQLQCEHMDRLGLPRPIPKEHLVDEGEEEALAPEDFYDYDDEGFEDF